jgi:hypothetical protein
MVDRYLDDLPNEAKDNMLSLLHDKGGGDIDDSASDGPGRLN